MDIETTTVAAPEAAAGVPGGTGIALSPAVSKPLTDALKKQEEKTSPTPTAPAANASNEEASAKQAAAQETPLNHKQSSNKKEKKHSKHQGRYTTGEMIYDQVNFWIIKGVILAATAAIAYYAKFGAETNWLRKVQVFFMEKVAAPMNTLGGKMADSIRGTGAVSPMREKIASKTHEVMAVLGGAFASTMMLMHGGNIVAPLVLSFENHRKELIERWNKRWGKEGDVEIANKKFERLPRQNITDVAKGRGVAWLTVFSSFVAAFIFAGKMKGFKDLYRFDWYEEKFARWTSGFTKQSSPFKNIPMDKPLHDAAKEIPELAAKKGQLVWYRIMKIIALDFYATSMGIIVWNFTSRLSAKKREQGGSLIQGLKAWIKDPFGRQTESEAAAPQNAPAEKGHTDKAKSQDETRSAALSEKPKKSFTDRTPSPVATHKDRAERAPEQGTGLAVV